MNPYAFNTPPAPTRRALLAGTVALCATLFAWSTPVWSGEFFERNGIAIDGFDPVAYFTAGKPMRGESSHSTTYKGSTFHFSSAQNKALFVADPEKYAPQYLGFCAYGVTKGAKVKTEGERWAVVDGKLYLNFDERVQAAWNEDIPGNIKKADEVWPTLK